MKKLLSILLIAAISITVFSGIITVNAETTSYQIGYRPYAENGISQEPIVTSGEGVKFYDDLFILNNNYKMDVLTDSNFINSMYLENAAQSEATFNGEVTSTASLETNSENVYGGTGKSYKLSYSKTPTGATPQGDTITRYYHRVTARTNIGPVKYTDAPDFTFAFWVKTEKPVYIAVRCMDYSFGEDKQFLISKEILVPAGESIVEVPFSHMAVYKDGYVKGNGKADAATQMKFSYPDILIRPQYAFGEGETSRNIYIDNIGFYLVASNGDKTAEHKVNAVSKLGDISGYTQVSGSTLQVQRGTTGYKWSTFEAASVASLSPCGTDDKTENLNAYKNAGQSICYTNTTTQYSGVGYNAFSTTDPIFTSDNYATFWYKRATIAIWIKTSRALKVYAEASDTTDNVTGKYKSSTYIVPAGESILRIPLSDFATCISGTDNPNRTWRRVDGLTLRFSAVHSTSISFNNCITRETTVYFDALRVECPRIGDSNEDGRIDLVDLVRIKKFIANNDATADTTLYDVGSEEFDDDLNRFMSDGVVDAFDLSILRRFLLGNNQISVVPFTDSPLAVATLSSWGFDS